MEQRSFKDKYIGKQRDLAEKSLYPAFPKILKIDACNTCNYNCIFCPQSAQHNKKGCIDKDLCLKVMEDAYEAGARELCLSMTGEPLLNRDLEAYVAYAKELGYSYVFFNTNGYLLTRERSEKLLESGLDSIKISLNASHSYALVHGVDGLDQVSDNVKTFNKLRESHARVGGG